MFHNNTLLPYNPSQIVGRTNFYKLPFLKAKRTVFLTYLGNHLSFIHIPLFDIFVAHEYLEGIFLLFHSSLHKGDFFEISYLSYLSQRRKVYLFVEEKLVVLAIIKTSRFSTRFPLFIDSNNSNFGPDFNIKLRSELDQKNFKIN